MDQTSRLAHESHASMENRGVMLPPARVWARLSRSNKPWHEVYCDNWEGDNDSLNSIGSAQLPHIPLVRNRIREAFYRI